VGCGAASPPHACIRRQGAGKRQGDPINDQRARCTAMQKVANRDVWDFGWEVAHAAVSRRPPTPLDTVVARTHMYAYDVGLGCVPHSRTIFGRPVPNLSAATRNFVSSLYDGARPRVRRRLAQAVRVSRTCLRRRLRPGPCMCARGGRMECGECSRPRRLEPPPPPAARWAPSSRRPGCWAGGAAAAAAAARTSARTPPAPAARRTPQAAPKIWTPRGGRAPGRSSQARREARAAFPAAAWARRGRWRTASAAAGTARARAAAGSCRWPQAQRLRGPRRRLWFEAAPERAGR
jgi:hypothetical protein